MMRKRRTVLLAAVLAAFAAEARQASPQPEAKARVVRTVGMADIRQAGEAEAYDRARQDARRKAVEEAIGTFVDAQVVTENGTLIQDRIVGRAAGYIRKEEPVRRWREGNLVYWEGVFTVGMDQLKNDVLALDLAQSRMRMPRVLIFASERYGNRQEAGSAGAVYAEVAKKFGEKRFVLVTRQPGMEAEERAVLANLQDPTKFVEAAVRLGAKTQAEMVVVAVGQAQVASVQPEVLAQSGMKSYQGSVSLQVVNVADRRVLASVSKNAAAPHIDETTGCQSALRKAAGPAADEAIAAVLAAWEDILNNGNLLTLNVMGLSIAEGFQFQKALESRLREVKEVFPKRNENGSSQFTVRYLGDGRDLAMALSTVDMGFAVTVESFDASVVTVRAAKR